MSGADGNPSVKQVKGDKYERWSAALLLPGPEGSCRVGSRSGAVPGDGDQGEEPYPGARWDFEANPKRTSMLYFLCKLVRCCETVWNLEVQGVSYFKS